MKILPASWRPDLLIQTEDATVLASHFWKCSSASYLSLGTSWFHFVRGEAKKRSSPQDILVQIHFYKYIQINGGELEVIKHLHLFQANSWKLWQEHFNVKAHFLLDAADCTRWCHSEIKRYPLSR